MDKQMIPGNSPQNTNNSQPAEAEERRLSMVERKLDVFETKMDQIVRTVERASEKMDGHFVTKQEQELRTQLLVRDIEHANAMAKKVHDEIEWVKRGVITSVGGVALLIFLKLIPMAGALK